MANTDNSRFVTNKAIVAELCRLAEANDGILLPEAVVAAARLETSAMHTRFQWDDTEAAHSWRMHVARNLIRVVVTYVGLGEKKTCCRVFISLTPDRDEGGYRILARVMGDDAQRAQLLQDALEEMLRFERKYAGLRELAGVFSAMRRARAKGKQEWPSCVWQGGSGLGTAGVDQHGES
jgi:hypothetical protein